MKGRGTRTLGFDDLKKVTPSVTSAKTHFVIVDAVGVTRSLKTDSRPLERKPTVSLKELLEAVTFVSLVILPLAPLRLLLADLASPRGSAYSFLRVLFPSASHKAITRSGFGGGAN